MAHESDPAEQNPLPGTDADARSRSETVAQPARRRALVRTIGAAPAVLTLVSNPVSATSCVVASSFVSALALASRTAQGVTPCAGRGPSSWQGSPASWPSPYCGQKTGSTPATNFCQVFTNVRGTSLTNKSTMMDALGRVSGTNGALANYCVAALLNAQSNKVSNAVLSPAKVIKIWNDVCTNGYYQATATVRFSPAQTVTWLASMMA